MSPCKIYTYLLLPLLLLFDGSGLHAKEKRVKYSKQPALQVIVDPGHGGEDYGTHSIEKPYFHEKFLTLTASFMLRNHLKNMGYDVIMTRQKDQAVELEERANISNKSLPALFVSVHFNSAANRDAKGIEVYYFSSKENVNLSNDSKLLADKVLDHMLHLSKAKSRGVKHANFSVLRNNNAPAILVEGGFLTNKEEMSLIKEPQYLNKLALGIAYGIDHYIRSQSKEAVSVVEKEKKRPRRDSNARPAA